MTGARSARPSDPDARPPHLQPRLLLLVAAGGAVGVLLRYAVAQAVPPGSGGWPTATLLTNLAGAFVLGALLESLVRSGPDEGRRRELRLGLGTGLLGGFTTYSALALETVLLVRADQMLLALSYALVSAVGGVLAAGAGVYAVGRHPAPGRG